MCRVGAQSYREQLLCARGSPPAMLSTQGLREGTVTEVTPEGVRAEEWPVGLPTKFICRAVHRRQRAGCSHHVELSCGPSKEPTPFLTKCGHNKQQNAHIQGRWRSTAGHVLLLEASASPFPPCPALCVCTGYLSSRPSQKETGSLPLTA